MKNKILIITLAVLVTITFSACSGKGIGGIFGSSATTVAGKVTLSGSLLTKPGMMAFSTALNSSKAANGVTNASFVPGGDMRKVLDAAAISSTSPLANGTVELYDADHPEWIYPVAVSLTDSQGNYLLNSLANSASNNASYTDGDPIPSGNYTVIASKYDVNVGKLFVGVQAVVKRFSGAVTGNDLQAPDSDAVPKVAFMYGKPKNSDGTFGGPSTMVPDNSAFPITFNMPMARSRAIQSISVIDATTGTTVDGTFTISPDLLTVNFHPSAPLTDGHSYMVKVLGGQASNAAKSIFGIPIPANVIGKFTASVADTTPPTVYPISPAIKTDVPIITPIRIAATKPLDVNTFTITSSPTIGDKPFIRYVGFSTLVFTGTPIDVYIYEIVPSSPLQINTTYTIGVSDARDMEGNLLTSTNIVFTTEATSTGIIPTDMNIRLAVKDVFGKWINALNSRNTALLTTYMTGNFYWLTEGNSTDDLNRDGRLSLNEFTTMFENMFPTLDRCNATVSGDIVDDNGAGSGISIAGSTATIKFNIAITANNPADPSCTSQPPQVKYAQLQNVNSGWLITNGSDKLVSQFPPSLRNIPLNSPANDTLYPEPTQAAPLLPEFSWVGVPGIKSYALVIIDTKAPNWQTGWVGLVDGTGTADNVVTAKYSPNGGVQGNVLVLGARPEFGFSNQLQFKSGGSYAWAVLGFKTLDVNIMNWGHGYDVVADLGASSPSANFDTMGVWKELTVTVKDSSGNSYPLSDYLGGYNVGSASTVILSVTSPDNHSSVIPGQYYVSGQHTWNYGPLTFNSYGVASATLNLTSKQSFVYVSDGINLSKAFAIYTTGGVAPNIFIDNVTGYDCNNNVLSSFPSDPWGHYTADDVCKIDIDGHIADPSITNVIVYVNSDNGWFNSSNSPTPVSGGQFSLTSIPVFHGWNQVEIYDPSNYQNVNDISVQSGTGSAMPSGVVISSVTYTTATGTASARQISQNIQSQNGRNQSYWDAGSASAITVAGTINLDPNNPSFTPQYALYVPPMWNAQSSGAIVTDASGIFTQPINLVNGWNVIQYSGPLGSTQMYVYTTGGSPVSSPHVITNISDPGNVAGMTPPVIAGYSQYDAGSSCSVTITGQSTNSGNANLYMFATNAQGNNYYEYVQDIPTTSSNGVYAYTITKNVYSGTNTIDLYDGSWIWRGIQVTTSCPNKPIAVTVTSVNDGVSNLSIGSNGWYTTTSSLVTVNGFAKAGKVVTAYVSGNSTSYLKSATAYSGDLFTIDLPLQAGYNSISLSDGNTSAWVGIISNNGTPYVAPINNVHVNGSLADSGGANTDNWGNWLSVTGPFSVSGNMVKCGNGAYTQKGSYNTSSGSFTCSGGMFIISNMQLDNGLNYVTLADSDGKTFYATINVASGGAPAPQQLVRITSPVDGSSTSGATSPASVTVYGNVDVNNFGATVGTVYAYVHDYYTGMSIYYSSNPADVTNLGYQPLTYTQGSFLFNTNVMSPSYKAVVEVYAFDTTGMISHGQTIVLNPTGYGDNVTSGYFKAGSSTSSSSSTFSEQTNLVRMLLKKKQ